MDHHCVILCTCIGYSNYKFFLLTLFYGNLLFYFMIITILKDSAPYYISEYGSNLNLYIFFFYIVLAFLGVSSALLSYFLFYIHFFLLVSNKTTIEHLEKHTNINMTDNQKNFYDVGIYHNISSVLGPFCFWLLPIAHNDGYQGYFFNFDQVKYEKLKKEYKITKDKKRKNTIITTL